MLVPRSSQDSDGSQGTVTLEVQCDVPPPETSDDDVQNVQCMYQCDVT